MALEAFYNRLTLSPADAESIWKKRGLPPSACEAYGLRSSGAHCRDLIEQMRLELGDAALQKAGLLAVDKESGALHPEPQFCGMGMTGKKRPDGDPEMKWGMNPVLIPYFDADDRLFALRPHKGGLPGRPSRFLRGPFPQDFEAAA